MKPLPCSASADRGAGDDRITGGKASLKQDAELIAAQAVGRPVAQDRSRQGMAQVRQELVSGAVAEGVVVVLESVQVEEGERRLVPVLRAPHRLPEVLDQPAAVGEAGEHVRDGVVGLASEHAPVFDVGQGASQS